MLKIRGEKMLTKEICKLAFTDVKKYGGNIIPPLAINILKRLIEEHFNPQPFKFEDLKAGMWVYDAPYEEIVKIKEIESNEWIFLECIKSKDLSNTFFQEGRFYPIKIPVIEGENK